MSTMVSSIKDILLNMDLSKRYHTETTTRWLLGQTGCGGWRIRCWQKLRVVYVHDCGAHLLLFFLAFVFGSFCTFCFHMLMYLFDEKCVLFPKLLSLTSLTYNIHDFKPINKEIGDKPVDFLSTQWVDKSMCSLPTYVPLVSGIFGLVWTTMFLMCSTGSRTLTGLQRPWRILPPVFVFSLAMGILCIYSSVITHAGLEDLCHKLGEITGSPTCSYTVNVATLVYERRIRGVYQATQLTILSAWLHTSCWLLSALLALVRVLLAVDFLLVRVSVKLHGNIDKIMEKNEVQIRTILPDGWVNNESECASEILIKTEEKQKQSFEEKFKELMEEGGDLIFWSNSKMATSELSLLPEESKKISLKNAIKRVSKDKAFIVKWLYNLVDELPNFSDGQREERAISPVSIVSSVDSETGQNILLRQFGQSRIQSLSEFDSEDTIDFALALSRVDSIILHQAQKRRKDSKQSKEKNSPVASTSRMPLPRDSDSDILYEEWKRILSNLVSGQKTKSSLKTVGVQTGKGKTAKKQVKITEKDIRIISDDDSDSLPSANKNDVEKETQTKEKEKQD